MSPTYFLCFALLISASQAVSGAAFETELENVGTPAVIEKFLTWLTSKINKLNDDIKAAEKGMIDNYHKLISEGEEKITEEVSNAKMFLQPLEELKNDKCVSVARSRLDAIQNEAVGTFKTCANLTDIFKDIKSILNETLGLGVELSRKLHEWARNMKSCLPVLSSKSVKCIVENVFKIFNDLGDIVKDCIVYGEKITVLNKKITAEIYACTHHSNGVNNQVQNVMAQLKTCANNQFF